MVDRKLLLISFSKLNVLSLVAFIAGSTKISFMSLKPSLRWLWSFRFHKVSVMERTHVFYHQDLYNILARFLTLIEIYIHRSRWSILP